MENKVIPVDIQKWHTFDFPRLPISKQVQNNHQLGWPMEIKYKLPHEGIIEIISVTFKSQR